MPPLMPRALPDRRRRGNLPPRPGSRPGVGRRPRRSEPGSAPRPRLTGRAAVLVLVVAGLMVSYASSFRAYLDQRHHIEQLQSSIAQSRSEIAALQREKQRWKDPAYVVAQARARFAFGFPGEIGFQVLDEDGRPLDHEDSLTDPAQEVEDPEWWQKTLGSVQAAGNPPREEAPAAKITVPRSAIPEDPESP
jgi:cell division protein FtsB